MNAPKPLCIACTHVRDADERHPTCGHLMSGRDLVKGEPKVSCANARSKHGFCGPEGACFLASTQVAEPGGDGVGHPV